MDEHVSTSSRQREAQPQDAHRRSPRQDHLRLQLASAAIPVTSTPCRTCSSPCDEGHDPYPPRFDVDWDAQLLGKVVPYRRQIVISTGKADWDHDISTTPGTLAAYMTEIRTGLPPVDPELRALRPVPGVFDSSEYERLSVLNGSHNAISDEDDTVLIFPDYKLISNVPRSLEGAQTLWDAYLHPSIANSKPPTNTYELRTWIIPYSCVILLCSHKKRDNRCSIAAGILENAFMNVLNRAGWTVETQIDISNSTRLPSEVSSRTSEEYEEYIRNELRGLHSMKKVLILKTSHVGGHKFAGNCIIYTPTGSGVWYGRVSTHNVESIVLNTIQRGLILPPLLRGGVNVSRPGRPSLHDW